MPVQVIDKKQELIQQTKLISVVFNYLKGASIDETRIILNEQCVTSDAKNLFESLKIDKETLDGLLVMLCVPEEAQPNYTTETNFFDLLTQLQLDGYRHNHLAYLLKLINQAKYSRPWHIHVAVITFLTTTISILCYVSPSFAEFLEKQFMRLAPYLLHWIEKTFSIFRNLPLVGMTYSAAKLLSNLYKTTFHGSTNYTQKLTTLCFQTFSGGFSLAGYVLSYLASGAATPLAGVFFVGSSVVDIIESFVTFYLIKSKSIIKTPPKSVESFEWRANTLCLETQRAHANHAVWVNALAAIAIAAAIAVWSFAPPSIPLILGCVLFMSSINYIKTSSIDNLDATYAKKLQGNIEEIASKTEMETSSLSPQEKETRKAEMQCAVLTKENQKLKKEIEELKTDPRFFQPSRAASTVASSNLDLQMSAPLRCA